jgi:hypothetical protein
MGWFWQKKQEPKDDANPPSRKRSSGHHSSSNVSASANHVNGYNKLLERLRSITFDPLGLVLTKFFHPSKDVNIPIMFEPNKRIGQMHASQTSELKKCVSAWIAWLKEPTPPGSSRETPLTDSLTKSMNRVWSNNKLYASHQDPLPWTELGTKKKKISFPDIVVHRATKRKHNIKKDPAVLLIEVGLERYHPLTKVDQAIDCEKILFKMGLFVEPTLMAVVRVVAEPGQFKKADLIVFLVIPRVNGDFRMTLLWHNVPETVDDFVRDFAQLMQATELVEDWRVRGASGSVDYEYLGPHCCRIGEQVRL